MKNVMALMRANPITVVSAVVALASIGFLVWLLVMAGPGLKARMADREGALGQLAGHVNRRVEVPAESPDAPPQEIAGVTINRPAVEQLENVFKRITAEHGKVFDIAVGINRGQHVVLLDNLFPSSGSNARYEAREVYREAFPRMLGKPGGERPLNLPRLSAGEPLPASELENAVSQASRETGAFNTERQELSEEERAQRRSQMQSAVIDRLRRRARSIKLYAETDLESEGFPFDVRVGQNQWAARGGDSPNKPSMAQIWEGQLELWIQQDIAEAINLANAKASNVLDAPVKRLIGIEVVPGYVGLHTRGAVTIGQADQNGQSGRGSRGRSYSGYRGRGSGAGSDDSGEYRGTYGAPAGGEMDEDDEPPNNFYITPTGRVSNPLYDVRHVRLDAVVDYQRLPALLDALSRVNFMTVLECQAQNVNEYDALRRGYVYGQGDAVRVNLVIETIWLRQWTSEHMPEPVRESLGMAELPDRWTTSRRN